MHDKMSGFLEKSSSGNLFGFQAMKWDLPMSLLQKELISAVKTNAHWDPQHVKNGYFRAI